MAIYGVGSNFGPGKNEEQKDKFIEKGKYILGWNYQEASDLHALMAAFKVGDILYLKTAQPGHAEMTIKAIGIVTKSLVHCLYDRRNKLDMDKSKGENLFVKVKWIYTKEFSIKIETGKMNNERSATIYEEWLPEVQDIIIDKITGTKVK
jgi:hypothetical protein